MRHFAKQLKIIIAINIIVLILYYYWPTYKPSTKIYKQAIYEVDISADENINRYQWSSIPYHIYDPKKFKMFRNCECILQRNCPYNQTSLHVR